MYNRFNDYLISVQNEEIRNLKNKCRKMQNEIDRLNEKLKGKTERVRPHASYFYWAY
jgi:peptidoglycan hydrolase CwlO-like protein